MSIIYRYALAFCKRLKIDNIRVYEQEQFKLEQETKEKRLKLSTQRSKLENTCVWPSPQRRWAHIDWH